VKPAVAFIRLGAMGHRMLANMTAHGGFDITLAWDSNADACLALEQQYPGLKIGSTAQEVITDPAIDVVYIASPPQSHREYTTTAAVAGKTVFCEKPLGINISESRSLV